MYTVIDLILFSVCILASNEECIFSSDFWKIDLDVELVHERLRDTKWRLSARSTSVRQQEWCAEQFSEYGIASDRRASFWPGPWSNIAPNRALVEWLGRPEVVDHGQQHGAWWPAYVWPEVPERCDLHVWGKQNGREIDDKSTTHNVQLNNHSIVRFPCLADALLGAALGRNIDQEWW